MFAGSCIGVVFLVVALEGLRRASREYDAYILRRAQGAKVNRIADNADNDSGDDKNPSARHSTIPATSRTFKPNVFQQAVRALLHMFQFAVAYFVMLLAM